MSAPRQLLIALAVAITVYCTVIAPTGTNAANLAEPHSNPPPQAADKEAPIAKLFDFAYYEQVFAKRYPTASERLARHTFYLAKAVKALVSGVKYKLRLASSYMAINPLSDRSPNELRRMRNKEKSQKGSSWLSDDHLGRANEEELVEVLDENVEEELRRQLAEHANESPYKELLQMSSSSSSPRLELGQDGHRRKREAPIREPREFSFDSLIKLDASTDEPGLAMSQVVPSNNDAYQWFDPPTKGFYDRVEQIKFRIVKPPESDNAGWSFVDNLVSQVKTVVSGQLTKFIYPEDPTYDEIKVPDKMFVDHRASGCMFKPREQGECGSCYAFASIAIMEWIYCISTGQLVAFSEQFMIDCGKSKRLEMNGCEGADDGPTFNFIKNYGLELKKNYPYVDAEQTCPYDEETTEKEQAGYIRMPLERILTVPISRWAKYIEYAPLYVALACYDDFDDYGGDVYDGADCGRVADHAMVLVGHGIQENTEYWLLRNSYGVQWGEKGYFKIAKSATEKCFTERVGRMVIPKNGALLEKNRDYKPIKPTEPASQLTPGDGQQVAVN